MNTVNLNLSKIPIIVEQARACGECNVCCTVAQIQDDDNTLFKEAWTPCSFLLNKREHHCAIYDKKPKNCTIFQCGWVKGFGTPQDSPKQNGVLVWVNKSNGGEWIYVIELTPNAATTTGKNIIMHIAHQINLPVIISKYNSRPPNDKGDFVMVKSSLLHRTNSMRGKLIAFLDEAEQFGVYELKIG